MKKGQLHTRTHMYKLYQITYKTSKPQINKLHAANQLTDLDLSGRLLLCKGANHLNTIILMHA